MNDLIPINTERYLLFAPDIHVGIGCKIHSTYSHDKFATALKQIMHKHPLLTSTILINDSNAGFYKLNSATPITIDYSNLGAKEWLDSANLQPFDFESGPLLKIHISQNGLSSDIAFLGSHMLGDGLSYTYLLQDFIAALADNLGDSIAFPEIISGKSNFPRKAQLDFIAKAFANSCNRKYQNAHTIADYQKLFYQLKATRKPEMIFHKLTRAQTMSIIQNCKSHNITVNSGITAAFFAARSKYNLSNIVGISNSVRNDLLPNPLKSMGNFVSGIRIIPSYDPSQPFWDLAKSIHQQIGIQLSSPKSRLKALSFLDALSDYIHDELNFFPFEDAPPKVMEQLEPKLIGERFKGLGISNLGVQDFENLEAQVSNVWFAPPLFGTGDMIVGAITVNYEMCLCIRFGSAEQSNSSIQRIIADAVEMLI